MPAEHVADSLGNLPRAALQGAAGHRYTLVKGSQCVFRRNRVLIRALEAVWGEDKKTS